MRAKNYIEKKLQRGEGIVYISCWAPRELKERLDRIAEREAVKRAAIIRAALSFFIDAYKGEAAEQAKLTPPPRLGWRPEMSMEVDR